MIVRFSPCGKSFKGLSTYLTHDPKANTQDRVAWTHTHNLVNDHVPSAVDEMVWTARNAELLKQEAGVRAGGRTTEDPAKQLSLNWSPKDNPTPEHMIQESMKFLRHMGWQEHQVIMVAHNDKPHPHVHLMINVIHPETGRHLDDGFERRRAQEWALAYELEHERVYCEQRLKSPEDREKNMPRNMWMAFQKNEQEFTRAEKIIAEKSPEIPENPKNAEWKILKEMQQAERIEHFASGKIEFSNLRQSIYREVKDEFRERWADYYRADKKTTGDDRRFLTDVKAQLIADQKAVLEPRWNEACKELRESRDERYRGILDNQGEARAALRWHQEAGLDTAPLFNELAERKDARAEVVSGFHRAAHEVASQPVNALPPVREEAVAARDDNAFEYDRPDVSSTIGNRVTTGAGSFLGALFSDLANLGSARPEPVSREERADAFREAAENTVKQHQHQEKEEDDARSRERQRTYGE